MLLSWHLSIFGVPSVILSRIDKALDRVFPNEPTPEQRSLLYHIVTAFSHFGIND